MICTYAPRVAVHGDRYGSARYTGYTAANAIYFPEYWMSTTA